MQKINRMWLQKQKECMGLTEREQDVFLARVVK